MPAPPVPAAALKAELEPPGVETWVAPEPPSRNLLSTVTATEDEVEAPTIVRVVADPALERGGL